jgi:uncharacterized membrane protein HdeD (DUF308 family)
MAKVEVRASGLWRALEIIGGLIVIAAAVIALADPQFVVNAFVIVIAFGLVLGGLFRIGVGIFAAVLPSTLRMLNTGGGIVAFVLGVAALLNLGATLATLIAILALALLLIGAFEIGFGIARHPPKWLKASIIILGILTIVLAGVVVVDMTLGNSIIAAILALALLFLGVRNLVHGITGHHPVATPIDVSVTAA